MFSTDRPTSDSIAIELYGIIRTIRVLMMAIDLIFNCIPISVTKSIFFLNYAGHCIHQSLLDNNKPVKNMPIMTYAINIKIKCNYLIDFCKLYKMNT